MLPDDLKDYKVPAADVDHVVFWASVVLAIIAGVVTWRYL